MSQPGLADALRACRGSGHGNGAKPLTETERSLDESRLLAELADNELVDRVVVLETVDSTNEEIRRRAHRSADRGLVVIANQQSAGRGRRGRHWHSPPGLGLYLSVLLRPCVPVDHITRWTLAASVAGCEACREVARCGTIIEWPNDLVVGGCKVGGVLAELRSAGGRARELVIGVGFNVHHGAGDWPDELAQIAVSLRQAAPCGIVVERESLAVAYLRRLQRVVTALERGRWNEVASRWEALAPRAHGTRVRVRRRNNDGARIQVEGVTAGLDSWGALQVRATDGRLTRVHVAESVTVQEG